ncbi:MAG: hypothetical protein IJB13_02045 [Clostridia bacterium]|nr:hypothetical protein [Clostridia bacterium]MBQ6883346.1 hypothetical protein [Clostridia bacterium]
MIKEQPLTTDLIGEKTLKTDNKIEFFGSVDELSAFIMEFIHHIDDKRLEMHLRKIVSLLSTMMGEVAGGFGHIGELHLSELLSVISDYESKVGAFNGFCLPGETLLGAKAHVLRTITRRAERAYARVFEADGGSLIIFEYLNKLSTFFYALGRYYDEVVGQNA